MLFRSLADTVQRSEKLAVGGGTWRDRVPAPTETGRLFDADQPASQPGLFDRPQEPSQEVLL